MARGSAERRFRPEPASVGLARRFVAETLAGWDVDHQADSAVSVCSELATNAVLHAQTPFTVRLKLRAGSLRIEVADDSPRKPRQRGYSRAATTGRGLAVVAGLSSSWGASAAGSGKTVWAELRDGNVEGDFAELFADDIAELSTRPTSQATGGHETRALAA